MAFSNTITVQSAATQSSDKSPFRGQPETAWGSYRLAACLAILAVLCSATAVKTEAGTPSQPSTIHVGIGSGTWGGVNRNDACAAIKVWAKAILSERGTTVAVETELFDTPEAGRRALKNGQVDAISMLTEQFLALEPGQRPNTVFVATKDHSLTERFVLLVNRETGIETLAGLAGRKLLLLANGRTSLAPRWLDTLLAGQSLGPAEKLLGTVTKIESPSKAILQVFFHQAEACLVTSNMFEVACELNPQLRKNLKLLAMSPEVVPALFFFRSDFTASNRQQLESAILSMHETTAGLEVLTVFQSDDMVKRPITCLDGTRQLLADYERSVHRQATNPPLISTQTSPPNEPH